MSRNDRDRDGDDARIDLSPWAAPTPPRGLSGRVLDAVRASADGDGADRELRDRRGTRDRSADNRRWAGVIGGLMIGFAAAGTLWALWPSPPRSGPGSGHVMAAAPSKISLGGGTVALLSAGADLRWQRDGDTLAVTHGAGGVTYQHTGPARLVITTPAGTVQTGRATLHLEVPVNKQIISAAVGAATAAVVVVAVYEGKAEVTQPASAPRVVESGGQVALAAPAPSPGPGPRRFETVVRATRDQAQRDSLAAAIAAARAGGDPARTGPSPGGAIVPAAPAGGLPPPVDPTPGELSKDEIRAGVKELQPLLTECYETLVDSYPSLSGTVMAKLTVDSEPDLGTIVTMSDDSEVNMRGDGSVDRAALAGDFAEFRQCLTATLESVVLPPLGDKDGGQVTIQYPFAFSTSPDPAADPAADPPASTPRRTPPPAPAVSTDAVELLARAETAAKSSQWGPALSLAETALATGPDAATRTRAHLIGALAACNLKSVSKARLHYAGASTTSQRLVLQRCEANGVDPRPAPPHSDGVVDPFKQRKPSPPAKPGNTGGDSVMNPFAE